MAQRATSPTSPNRSRTKPGVPAKVELNEPTKAWDHPTVRLIGFGVLAVVFAFFIMNAIFGDNGWMVYRRQQRQLEVLKREVNRLQKENQDLEKQIQGLRSDPKVIDRLAHDQLHLVAPNQTIYTLPERDSKAARKQPPTDSSPPAKP